MNIIGTVIGWFLAKLQGDWNYRLYRYNPIRMAFRSITARRSGEKRVNRTLAAAALAVATLCIAVGATGCDDPNRQVPSPAGVVTPLPRGPGAEAPVPPRVAPILPQPARVPPNPARVPPKPAPSMPRLDPPWSSPDQPARMGGDDLPPRPRPIPRAEKSSRPDLLPGKHHHNPPESQPSPSPQTKKQPRGEGVPPTSSRHWDRRPSRKVHPNPHYGHHETQSSPSRKSRHEREGR